MRGLTRPGVPPPGATPRRPQLMDMCVEQTHVVTHEMRSNEKPLRYTDTRMDEQVRAACTPPLGGHCPTPGAFRSRPPVPAQDGSKLTAAPRSAHLRCNCPSTPPVSVLAWCLSPASPGHAPHPTLHTTSTTPHITTAATITRPCNPTAGPCHLAQGSAHEPGDGGEQRQVVRDEPHGHPGWVALGQHTHTHTLTPSAGLLLPRRCGYSTHSCGPCAGRPEC